MRAFLLSISWKQKCWLHNAWCSYNNGEKAIFRINVFIYLDIKRITEGKKPVSFSTKITNLGFLETVFQSAHTYFSRQKISGSLAKQESKKYFFLSRSFLPPSVKREVNGLSELFLFLKHFFVRRRRPHSSLGAQGRHSSPKLAWHCPRHGARPFQALFTPQHPPALHAPVRGHFCRLR